MGGLRTVLVVVCIMSPLALNLPFTAADGASGAGGEPARVDAGLEAWRAEAADSDRVRVIVTLDAPETDPSSRFDDAGEFSVFHVFDREPYGFAADVTREQLDGLTRARGVAAVAVDELVHATMNTADASFGAEKARADFGVTGDGDGNPTTYSKDDAVVCVIDTGVDGAHVDLDGGKIIGWNDLVNGRSTPYDDNGHGTHVAGIVAGTGEGNAAYAGVAPGAAIVGVKVLNSAGSGYMSTVRAGIDWCVAQRDALGVDVVSLSLGTSGSSNGGDESSLAVDRAYDAGVLPVVAAGNSGPARATIGSPGAARKALTVGAMIDTGENGFALAYFSSRGPTADGRIKPDLAAPGWAITAADANTGNRYVSLSGTSMATPFVSGVAALLAAEGLGAAAIKNALLSTAQDWGAAGQDVDYGHGRLRAYDAVREGLDGSGTGPAEPIHKHLEGNVATGARVLVPIYLTEKTHPLALTLITPSWASGYPDLDLYVYAPGADTSNRGNALAKSDGGTRQETIRLKPTTAGLYHVEVHAYAGGGAWSLDVSADLDVVAPLTSAAVEGPSGLAGWLAGPASVTLSATDDAAGVRETRYRLPAGAPDRAYSAPLDLSADGVHDLSFWSVDRADNVEAKSSLTVRVDGTAPATAVSLSGVDGLAGWFRGDVTATLSATDATSGVAVTEWALDGAPAVDYSVPFRVAGDGTHAIAFGSTDVAGNREDSRSAAVRIDATPPRTAFSTSGPEGDAGWFRGPVSVALAAEDATSGVASSVYALDGAPAVNYSAPFRVEGDGAHAVSYRSTDVAGNEEVFVDLAIRVDATAPETTAAAAGPDGAAGWFRGPVDVSLSAVDATSGVAATRWSLDDSAESDYAMPIRVAGDGTHRVSFLSRDVAGNPEGARDLTVRIDGTAPATTHAVVGPEGRDGWFLGDADVRLSAADATSGVAATRWSLDGASVEEGDLVAVRGDGAHAVEYGSLDVAGNAEAWRRVVVRVDATAPDVALSVDEPYFAGAREFVAPHTPLTMSGADALSGVHELRYRVGDGEPVPYAGAFTLGEGDGLRVVRVSAEDVAGNAAPERERALFVDGTPPTLNVTKPAPGSVWLPQASLGPFLPQVTGGATPHAVAVQGARVAVWSDAADPISGGDASGIARVDVIVDRVVVATLTEAPYRWDWDTSSASPGEHEIVVVAIDRLGNATEDRASVLVLGPDAAVEAPAKG